MGHFIDANVRYDGTDWVVLAPLPVVGHIPVRHTVHAGPMDTGGVNAVLSTSMNLKTISYSHSATTPYIRPFAGGASATITTANWRVQGRVKRLF